MARFSKRPSSTPPSSEIVESFPASRGLRPWIIWACWIAVIAALYLGMSYLLAPPKAVYFETGQGELRLPRQGDGHFYVDGAINGVPVQFMVDTGASVVAITNTVAQAAGLDGGRIANFSTAGGTRQGRIARVETLQVSGFQLKGMEVGTGLSMKPDTRALLGQNVLRHFDIQIDRDQMILTPR